MTTLGDSPDVVIIGGGVIGCAIAYHLGADHGMRSVIVERNAIGSEASGGAAGELAAAEMTEHGAHPPGPTLTRFLKEGVSLHRNLAPALLEESGIDYLLTDTPMLRPAFTSNEEREMRWQIGDLRSSGSVADWIDRETVAAKTDWLADDVLGAIQSVELQVEAYPFTLALAQAAEANGAEIRTGEVTGVEVSGSRAAAVRIGNETLSAGNVVIASGPWAKEAGRWVGLDVPMVPLRGQIVHLDIPPGIAPPEHAFFHPTGYVLPKPSGDLFVGTTVEDIGFDRTTTNEARDTIMAAVGRMAPRVLDFPIREMTACLRPYSLDGKPFIGAVPGIERLFISTGHAFKGITLALITGRSVAELIASGHSTFPLDDFSPDRIART